MDKDTDFEKNHECKDNTFKMLQVEQAGFRIPVGTGDVFLHIFQLVSETHLAFWGCIPGAKPVGDGGSPHSSI